jgi:transcriptional regulator with XRE-family HTH domain
VNAIDHVPTPVLNAIVFSNFPDTVFDNDIRDKLVEHHVNVIRVFRPDRVDVAVADVSKADAVIVFIDFMSHSQDEIIRKKARLWKRPIASLRRQSSEWPKILDAVMPKPKSFGQLLREERENSEITIKDVAEKTKASIADVKAWEDDEKLPTGSQMSRLRIVFNKIAYHPAFRATPVVELDKTPEGLPPEVKLAMHTFMTLTMAGVGDDEMLQALREVYPGSLKDLDQAEDLFERYVKTDCAPTEFRSWWNDYQKPTSAPPSLRVVPSASPQDLVPEPPPSSVPEPPPSQVDVLERQLHEAKTMEAMYDEELKKLRDENASIKDQLQKTFRQFQGAQGAKVAADQRHEAELTRVRDENSSVKAAARSYEAELIQRQKELESVRAMLTMTDEEMVKIRARHVTETDDLHRQIAEAKAENGKASSGNDLDTIAASFRTLYKLGFMNRADIAEKLVNQVLGNA